MIGRRAGCLVSLIAQQQLVVLLVLLLQLCIADAVAYLGLGIEGYQSPLCKWTEPRCQKCWCCTKYRGTSTVLCHSEMLGLLPSCAFASSA
jgi:hypothetical protein